MFLIRYVIIDSVPTSHIGFTRRMLCVINRCAAVTFGLFTLSRYPDCSNGGGKIHIKLTYFGSFWFTHSSASQTAQIRANISAMQSAKMGGNTYIKLPYFGSFWFYGSFIYNLLFSSPDCSNGRKYFSTQTAQMGGKCM